jgi:hypothetical protein
LTALDSSVAARCGSPSGGAGCLVVHENPEVPPDLRSVCTIDALTYSPAAIDAGAPEAQADGGVSGRVLQRGTTVSVTTVCPAPGGADAPQPGPPAGQG